MKRRRLVALFALALAACGEKTASVPPPPSTEAPIAVREIDLASVMNGATVIDRTAEASLDHSALAAFDSDRKTVWSTPPVNLRQTVTIALPVKARVERIAVTTESTGATRGVRTLEFSTSSDGVTFSPGSPLVTPKQVVAHAFPITAVDARFLLFTTIDTHGPTEVIDVPAIEVRGKEQEAFAPRSLSGDWKINDVASSFDQEGLRARGVIRMDPPMFVDGAWHERAFRFLWIRGKKKGIGVLTLDPESRRLSGFWWFGEPRRDWLGAAIFGEKLTTATAFEPANVMKFFLDRDRSSPMPNISSAPTPDEGNASILAELRTLIAGNPSARFRITARDWTGATFEQRQQRAEKQIALLRREFAKSPNGDLANLSFAAVGEPDVSAKSDQPLSRLLMSRFVLEVEVPSR